MGGRRRTLAGTPHAALDARRSGRVVNVGSEPPLWQAFLTAHGLTDDPEYPCAAMPLDALLVVLMSTDPVEHDYDEPRDVTVMPPGSPRTTTVRACAAEIIRRADSGDESTPIDDRIRVLALTRLHHAAQRRKGENPDGELLAHLESCRSALRLARARRDDDALLAAGYFTVKATYIAQAWEVGIQVGTSLLAAMPAVHEDSEATGPSIWEPARSIVADLRSRSHWRLRTRFAILQSMASISGAARDADWGDKLRAEMAAVGDALGDDHPRARALALDHERVIARRQGNRSVAMSSIRKLEAWYERHPRPEVKSVLLSARSDMALSVNDYQGKLPFNHESIGISLAKIGIVVADPQAPTLEEARAAVELGESHGLREGLRRLGNSAYNFATALSRAGRTSAVQGTESDTALMLSDEWLDVARSAWRTFGVNGLSAVEFSLIRNAIYRGVSPEQGLSLTDELLALLGRSVRGGLRRNICRLMTKVCAPDDPRVEASLRDILRASPTVYRGALHGALAELYARRARSADGVAADELWLQVEEAALEAVQDLRYGNTYIDPEEAGRAYRLIAESSESRTDEDPDVALRYQLEMYLKAIHCLAFSLLLISSDVERQRVRRDASPALAAAARAAAALGEGRAADVIMEAIRKDRVGVLLAELRRDPTVGDRVRRHADEILAAFVALPEADDDREADGGTESLTREAHVIESRRDQAIRAAEGVLGPLTAMIRPTFERQAATVDLLRHLHSADPPNARMLLQFARLDLDGQTATLARRVSWIDGDVERDHLDIIEVDARLLAARPSEPGFFSLLPALAAALLPPDAVGELLRDRPVALRLHVIPTGLHHVPFEALPLNETTMVIDRAIVSVHTGLTSMAALLDIHQRPSSAAATVVFDPHLTHAQAELESIKASLSVEVEAHGIGDLQRAFEAPISVPGGVFVMAVHGTESENGWGQTKRMPDGISVLRPADLMAWTLPRLCVMASCHSSIEAVDGAELSGFPLAMFLRGATTVIGTVLAVPDRSTSEIMSAFWGDYRTTTDPVESLRTAKLQWMAADPVRRGSHREWAGIVLYGGAHH